MNENEIVQWMQKSLEKYNLVSMSLRVTKGCDPQWALPPTLNNCEIGSSMDECLRKLSPAAQKRAEAARLLAEADEMEATMA